jgi:hypothetical protein
MKIMKLADTPLQKYFILHLREDMAMELVALFA